MQFAPKMRGSVWNRVIVNNLGNSVPNNRGNLAVNNTPATTFSRTQNPPPSVQQGNFWDSSNNVNVKAQFYDYMTAVTPGSGVPSLYKHFAYSYDNGKTLADAVVIGGGGGAYALTVYGGTNMQGPFLAYGPGTFNGPVSFNNSATFYSGLTAGSANTYTLTSTNISASYIYSNSLNGTYAFISGYVAAAAVNAGSGSDSNPSALHTETTFGLKLKRLIASNTYTGNETNYILDATNAAACTGTISNVCSYWTDYTACAANAWHGGCSWAGADCSSFNGNYSACTTTSGCTWQAADCSGFNGDYYSCVGNSGCSWTGSTVSCAGFGDYYTCVSYGGCNWSDIYADCSVFVNNSYACTSTSGCSWNEVYADCGAFNNNEGGCYSEGGCSWSPAYGGNCNDFNNNSSGCSSYGTCSYSEDAADCNNFSTSNGYADGGATCGSYGGCSWSDDGSGLGTGTCSGMYDPGTGTCSGSYDNGSGTCSGSYDTGTQDCTGTYDPQTCTGTYATNVCYGTWYGCQGTATCIGIGDSTSCGAEAGCSWTALMTQTLENVIPDKEHRFKNDTPTGVLCRLYAAAGEYINSAAYIDLPNYEDGILLVGEKVYADCNIFGDSGGCTSHSGCSWTYSDCSSNFFDGDSCNAQSGCSWDGENCNGTYNAYCYGQYTVKANWHKMANT
jgi:hypothetical protein